MRTRYSVSLLFAALLFCAPTAAAQQYTSAAEVVAHWWKAVHAKNGSRPVAVLAVTESTEDGVAGHIREWLAKDGRYRRETKRDFDEAEIVVGQNSADRRDWNSFVRHLEGEELKRLRTQIFETQTLLFGPPASAADENTPAKVKDGLDVVQVAAAGSLPVTWYIDPKTWLPVKSTRPGEDSTITSDYGSQIANWKNLGNGVLTPVHAKVSETDKPDYDWERKQVAAQKLSESDFSPPKPGPSDVKMSARVPPIPFTFEASHIVIPVQVNGRPPIGFIFDTGADQEVVNSTRLEQFGLKTYARSMATGGGNAAEYSYAKDATFSVPGAELVKQHVAVLDQTGLEQALGIPIGGLLGYDFISRFVVEIDYQKRQMILHDPKTWSYSGNGFSVPMIFDNGIPFTHGKISVPAKADIPAFFVIDFGAAETMTLTSPFVKANDLARLAQTNATVNRPAGMEKQFFAQNNVRGRIARLDLGGLEVKDIPINMSVNTKGAYASENFSGTIGETIFRRYHVFLDYPRNRAIFEPTAEATTPFPERQTYGLSLLASEPDLHTFTVVGVRTGSGAERDGFKKGDKIVALDSKPSSGFLLSELRDTLTHGGERHQIDVQRDKETIHLPVEVTLVSLDSR